MKLVEKFISLWYYQMGIYIQLYNNKDDDSVTDKELKKLSKLELLELLLAETREHEHLREELEKAKKVNSVEKSAQILSETAKQLDEALKKVSLLSSEKSVDNQAPAKFILPSRKASSEDNINFLSIISKDIIEYTTKYLGDNKKTKKKK